MACVGLAYYAGLVCDAWPFLQLQLQRPPPLSAHASPPPPHPVPDHTIGGGAGNARRLTIYIIYICICICKHTSLSLSILIYMYKRRCQFCRVWSMHIGTYITYLPAYVRTCTYIYIYVDTHTHTLTCASDCLLSYIPYMPMSALPALHPPCIQGGWAPALRTAWEDAGHADASGRAKLGGCQDITGRRE